MKKRTLTLDYIKITPELIETINSLQTGGTIIHDIPLEEKFFNNCTLNDCLSHLSEVMDFIIDVQADSPVLFEVNQFSNLLITLRYFKTLLNGLAAPQPEKKISTI